MCSHQFPHQPQHHLHEHPRPPISCGISLSTTVHFTAHNIHEQNIFQCLSSTNNPHSFCSKSSITMSTRRQQPQPPTNSPISANTNNPSTILTQSQQRDMHRKFDKQFKTSFWNEERFSGKYDEISALHKKNFLLCAIPMKISSSAWQECSVPPSRKVRWHCSTITF